MSKEKKLFLARFGSTKHVDQLMHDPDWTVRKAIVDDNPTVTQTHLNHLMNDRSILVRGAVASKIESDESLTKLVNDPMDFVRVSAAKNSNLKQHHIDRLSRDSSSRVVDTLIDHAHRRKKD